ncbi:MAG: magnesium transporter [Alphaproteobacteria bacterium]|nr:magnesium transporter [Alphaproteobacteria bacterium]
MIRTYRVGAGGIVKDDSAKYAANAVWIDLLNPTKEEEKAVEEALKVSVPSREEMAEIEVSSRLYQEDEGTFMTATVIQGAETDAPQAAAITFVLVRGVLVTVRHADPQPFRMFAQVCERRPQACANGEFAFFGILEAIIDRLADILERANAGVDAISREVFLADRRARRRSRDHQKLLGQVGRIGDLTSKGRESLVTIGRLLTFYGPTVKAMAKAEGPNSGPSLKTMNADIASLSDHATFLSNKVTFLLEAILGTISIEQNEVMKIFSVVAVVFLPPTLVASVWGMNFEFMPELQWPLGYPVALVTIALAAVLPVLYFRKRGWL